MKSNADHLEVARQAARFSIVGLANTLVTGAVFYLLTFAMPASIAYTIAFAVGIVFAVSVTPHLVFLVRPRASRRAAYAAWYVAVYLVGLGAVQVLDGWLQLDHSAVVALTILITATLGFVGGRSILVA